MQKQKSGLQRDEAGRVPVFWPLVILLLAVLLCLLCYEKAGEFLNWLFGDAMSALLPQQPAARPERFGTKFNTAVNGFYKSLDDTFKSFTLTAENGLDQIRAQSIGGSTAKGE